MFVIAKLNYNGLLYTISVDQNKNNVLSCMKVNYEKYGNWVTNNLSNYREKSIDIPEKYDITDIVKAFCKFVLGEDKKKVFMSDVISLYLAIRYSFNISKNEYLSIVSGI